MKMHLALSQCVTAPCGGGKLRSGAWKRGQDSHVGMFSICHQSRWCFCHIGRTVLDKYLLSYHTVLNVGWPRVLFSECLVLTGWKLVFPLYDIPDSKIHGTNMGPTWVLSAPDGPHVGLMNLAIWDAWLAVCLALQSVCCYCRVWRLTPWEKTACLNGVPKCWDFEAHHGKVDIEPSLHNQWCPDYPQWPSQLALRRWPNVNPYVGPTSAHRR